MNVGLCEIRTEARADGKWLAIVATSGGRSECVCATEALAERKCGEAVERIQELYPRLTMQIVRAGVPSPECGAA